MRNMLVVLLVGSLVSSAVGSDAACPNFVILFADDLGYGDLSCYGDPTIRTPELDRMAAQGMRFTQFYSAACVCTPSRAALLTGRLPIRSGLNAVLFPASKGGIPDDELTLAEALKTKGYATACIGKWHLGHVPQYLPTRHGFDRYFGLPYSNDMHSKQRDEPPVPLLRDESIIEQPVVQQTLTQRYTDEAIRFIKDCQRVAGKRQPFFLYVPYTMPHVPLHASDRFRGKSPRGLYGDVVEEIDWSVGQILQTLRDEKLSDNTLAIFTSDNGPWLIQKQHGGSAGLLREGKGSTWEGGMREPAIAWRPGKIPAGVVSHELASTLDIFPTCLALAGIDLPSDRPIDGVDLRPVLFGSGKSPRELMFYYRGSELFAVRKGPWKLHLKTANPASGQSKAETHDPPLLFHLEHDPSERFNVASEHADVIADLLHEVELHRSELKPGQPQT